VFRRQPVVHGNNRRARQLRQTGTHIVVAVERAQHVTTSVQVDQPGTVPCLVRYVAPQPYAAVSPGRHHIVNAHTLRASAVEVRTQPVIAIAHLLHAQMGRVVRKKPF
jgi:hypothetical protein